MRRKKEDRPDERRNAESEARRAEFEQKALDAQLWVRRNQIEREAEKARMEFQREQARAEASRKSEVTERERIAAADRRRKQEAARESGRQELEDELRRTGTDMESLRRLAGRFEVDFDGLLQTSSRQC